MLNFNVKHEVIEEQRKDEQREELKFYEMVTAPDINDAVIIVLCFVY